MYVPSLISIPFVLSKIWPEQATNMKIKWLWVDNSVNIQGRILVSFQSLLYFPRYGPDSHIHYQKINVYGEITQQISRVGLWFLGSALPLIAIYLYTKFYLNANSSFKVICRIRYRTDGQRGDYMLPPLGSIKILLYMDYGYIITISNFWCNQK